MTLLTYVGLFIGLGIAYLILYRPRPESQVASVGLFEFGKHRVQAGILLFIIGMACNLVIIKILLQEVSFFEIASTRAMATSNAIMANPFFCYLAFYFVPLPQYALFILAFETDRKRLCVILYLLFAGVLILYGGRFNLLMFTCEFIFLLLLFTRENKGFRLRIRWALFVIVPLFLITALRYNQLEFTELVEKFTSSLTMREMRVHQTAWIINLFPNEVPYAGLGNCVVSFNNMLPGITTNAQSLISEMRDLYFAGGMAGRGMYSFPNAAEFYSWGGIGAILCFPFIYGILFGGIMLWPCIQRQNPYVYIYALIVLFEFFVAALPARMPESIGKMLSPMVFLAVAAVIAGERSRFKLLFISAMVASVTAFVAWRGIGIDFFKYTCVAIVAATFICAFLFIGSISRPVTSLHHREDAS
ncbi:MAG TPA: hypothetical protein DET40_00835 [Lentisphaeria bacterium]|nr:MAG: hypothetical protein A2X45_06340 [Lentisphaerae bacterium GWF2_50_93]HCE42077.1 hypothetical protein [Lentisphaeria bacterium]